MLWWRETCTTTCCTNCTAGTCCKVGQARGAIGVAERLWALCIQWLPCSLTFRLTSLLGVCVKAPFRTAATLAFCLSGSSFVSSLFMFLFQQTDFFRFDIADYNGIKPKVPRKLIQCETFTKLRVLCIAYIMITIFLPSISPFPSFYTSLVSWNSKSSLRLTAQ